MDFKSRLNQAKNGTGILFCGSGFSADCLSFQDSDKIGGGEKLLSVLNSAIKEDLGSQQFKDIKNAADYYKETKGTFSLLQLLIDRFRISSVSDDMVEIVKFPWKRIYTTNYDNGLEVAFHHAKKPFTVINNIDRFENENQKITEIVHLHGYIEKWNIHNFESSCILGDESYHRLDRLKECFDKFRLDVNRAEIIIFVGTSLTDFHLSDILFNVSEIKKKLFFINPSDAENDLDIHMRQSRYGKPRYIGRRGLSKEIRESIADKPPEKPALCSFTRYELIEPSQNVPKVEDIENLLVFGKILPEQVARDIDLNKSDYHVQRSITNEIIDSLTGNVCIALLFGEICDGKSMILEEICYRLARSLPVFKLRHYYHDLPDEVGRILNVYPEAVVIIENCFDIQDSRLKGIVSSFNDSKGKLILTSRDIAVDAEANTLNELSSFSTFKSFKISSLDGTEIKGIRDLIEQVTGWTDPNEGNYHEHLRSIHPGDNNNLPRILIEILNSQYVQDKYKAEFKKIESLSEKEMKAVVIALYITNIGDRVSISFLSDLFEIDAGSFINKLNENTTDFKILRVRGGNVETVPSIGAKNILKKIIPPQLIVNTVVEALISLSESEINDDFRKYIFSQMMRYSILRSVIDDEDKIDNFFDNISKIQYFRHKILFWLQWHMAKLDQNKFIDAEKYLNIGYEKARQLEHKKRIQYNTKQLDDQKARLLIKRNKIENTKNSSTRLFHDINEAERIILKSLRHTVVTHHTFQTLSELADLFADKGNELDDSLYKLVEKGISSLISNAEKRISLVPDGYQTSRATTLLEHTKFAFSKINNS